MEQDGNRFFSTVCSEIFLFFPPHKGELKMRSLGTLSLQPAQYRRKGKDFKKCKVTALTH